MTTDINQILAAKRRAVQKAERDLDIARAELRSWEQAYNLLSATPAQRAAMRPSEQATEGERKYRALSEHWRKILQFVHRHYPLFNHEHLRASAGHQGIALESNTARSQMALYVNAGFVERVRPGQFRLTPKGLEAAGITETDASQLGGVKTEGASPSFDLGEAPKPEA